MPNHQRFLRFKVIDQTLRKHDQCDFSGIVAGSEGYLQAKFYFEPEEWNDFSYIRIASFWVASVFGLEEFSVKRHLGHSVLISGSTPFLPQRA